MGPLHEVQPLCVAGHKRHDLAARFALDLKDRAKQVPRPQIRDPGKLATHPHPPRRHLCLEVQWLKTGEKLHRVRERCPTEDLARGNLREYALTEVFVLRVLEIPAASILAPHHERRGQTLLAGNGHGLDARGHVAHAGRVLRGEMLAKPPYGADFSQDFFGIETIEVDLRGERVEIRADNLTHLGQNGGGRQGSSGHVALQDSGGAHGPFIYAWTASCPSDGP